MQHNQWHRVINRTYTIQLHTVINNNKLIGVGNTRHLILYHMKPLTHLMLPDRRWHGQTAHTMVCNTRHSICNYIQRWFQVCLLGQMESQSMLYSSPLKQHAHLFLHWNCGLVESDVTNEETPTVQPWDLHYGIQLWLQTRQELLFQLYVF